MLEDVDILDVLVLVCSGIFHSCKMLRFGIFFAFGKHESKIRKE